jgi:hypothetical protein
MPIWTIYVEKMAVGDNPAICPGRGEVVTHFDFFFENRRFVRHDDFQSHPGRKLRVVGQPSGRITSRANLVDYAIATVIIEIAKMDGMKPALFIAFHFLRVANLGQKVAKRVI